MTETTAGLTSRTTSTNEGSSSCGVLGAAGKRHAGSTYSLGTAGRVEEGAVVAVGAGGRGMHPATTSSSESAASMTQARLNRVFMSPDYSNCRVRPRKAPAVGTSVLPVV